MARIGVDIISDRDRKPVSSNPVSCGHGFFGIVWEHDSVEKTFKEAEAAFESMANIKVTFASEERKLDYRDHRID